MLTMRFSRRCCAALVFVFVQSVSFAAKRPMQVDDLFAVDGLEGDPGGSLRYSPDGALTAFSWQRPVSQLGNYGPSSPWFKHDADVWVQEGDRAPVNITHGDRDKTGWHGEVWSPDGSQLALIGTRGKNGPIWSERGGLLWVWNRKTHSLKRLSDQLVARYSGVGRGITWVDDSRVLVTFTAEQLPARPTKLSHYEQTALEGWEKTVDGRESTASVLDGGIPEDLSARPHAKLALVDVKTGRMTVLADGQIKSGLLSPDGKHVAYYEVVRHFAPTSGVSIVHSRLDGDLTVGVVDLTGKKLLAIEQATDRVVTGTVQWSADSGEIAFVRRIAGSDKGVEIVRAAMNGGAAKTVDLGSLTFDATREQVPDIRWTQAGDLVVVAKPTSGEKLRNDWYLLRNGGSQTCLTCALESMPGSIWPTAGEDAFVAAVSGGVWKIGLDGKTKRLTPEAPKLAKLAWPADSMYGDGPAIPAPGHRYGKVVAATHEEGKPDTYFLVDLQSGTVSQMTAPAGDAQLTAFDEGSTGSSFYVSGGDGTTLWKSATPTATPKLVRETNTFLREIEESRYEKVSYRSLNGRDLKAWLMLPANYQPGKRLPTLLFVYAGSMVSPEALRPSTIHRPGSSSFLNMQLAVANGFAVLIPSMPLDEASEADDPLLRLTDGVIPAIDKAVDLGYVDGDRLFVMGQSFGGFSTYGLIGQNERFKAAVAISGLSSLNTFYGAMPTSDRYSDHPNDYLGYFLYWAEPGQGHMGAPPWKDSGRYIRNSPITYVDRIKTPLMILQGDQDIGPIADSENMFRSLYRQGKRVRYVRYWGEGHIFASPANVRDMWTRVVSWLDENGNITRDAAGQMVFDGEKVKGR